MNLQTLNTQSMTPTQTLLTHLAASLVGAAICYAILTDADPTPLPVSVESIQAEERIRLRAEGAKDVRDSLEAVSSRISERPKQRDEVNDKWAHIAAERVSVSDSLVGVELINRIEQWK